MSDSNYRGLLSEEYQCMYTVRVNLFRFRMYTTIKKTFTAIKDQQNHQITQNLLFGIENPQWVVKTWQNDKNNLNGKKRPHICMTKMK